MASPPPPSLQAEGQTGGDFLDRLVNDEFGVAETLSETTDMARVLSSMSIGDDSVSEVDDCHDKKIISMEDSEAAGSGYEGRAPPPSNLVPLGEVEDFVGPTGMENDVVPVSSSSSMNEVGQKGGSAENMVEGEQPASSKSNIEGAKSTIVREVQWSSFNLDSQSLGFGGFGTDSYFPTGTADEADDRVNLVTLVQSSFVEQSPANLGNYFGSSDEQNAQMFGSITEQSVDVKNVEYWENLYPGWKYDSTSGQWYQADASVNTENAKMDDYGFESANAVEGLRSPLQATGDGFVPERRDISFLQQGAHSVLATIKEEPTTGSISNWSESSYWSIQYPPNMVFDPQYPEFYYDLNTQQWHTLESYCQAIQTTASSLEKQAIQDVLVSDNPISKWSHGIHNEARLSNQRSVQERGSQETGAGSDASTSYYALGNLWQSEPVVRSAQVTDTYGNLQTGSYYNIAGNSGSYGGQDIGSKASQPIAGHGFGFSAMPGFQSGHAENSARNQQMGSFNSWTGHGGSQRDQQIKPLEPVSSCGYGNDNVTNGFQDIFPVGRTKDQFVQPTLEQSPQAPLAHRRSSAGRPPHALVAFGFGGKVIVMRETGSFGTDLSLGSQGNIGSAVSILNLMELVMENTDASSMMSSSGCNYFHTLFHQAFSGPLVGGSAATKDVNKWLEERIMNCESANSDSRRGEHLRLLLSLLKISCQHYGKLRPPFVSEPSLEETDGPESAVTKLFASARKNSAHSRVYGGSFRQCMKSLPSEGQSQAAAIEVQSLLVSGRRKEALQCAQEGHLWGPALVLAAQVGEKFYVDTVKKMAHKQFISGSPLRTLCLLIAGQPADVFSSDTLTGAVNVPQPMESTATGVLDNWEENLAIITANRTKDDELWPIHLGDCLWKERGEVTAAHTCYLVAEANFESYSDSARLCLIGADHWKCPRTYASPEAIQRTELYEYSKVLGNSQYILLAFQPYKFVYASMLAEVGKVSDSLRYCQASLKSLKISGRAPEVEMWKLLFSNLEERLRTHQQGGYGTNLDPAKIVGKLFTSIDRSIHRMMGAQPPTLPPLIPSASVEGISRWADDNSRKTMHNRSISEPNFGRNPNEDSPMGTWSPDAQGKASSAGPSRFGRFGSLLLQKTIGWVSKSLPDRQAKLGESNKFYYDEKLRRWVEEGTEPPAEDDVLPPPPSTASFQNILSGNNTNNAFNSQTLSSANGAAETKSTMTSEQSSGLPRTTSGPNQFSARGRVGVRSRYVDTFNKGGGAFTRSYQSLAAPPSAKPALGANFFIPSAPATADEETVEASQGNKLEVPANGQPPSSVATDASLPSSSSSSASSMVRVPSTGKIAPWRNKGGMNEDHSLYPHARAASWAVVYSEVLNPTSMPVGDDPGGASSFRPNGPSQHLSSSSADLNTGSSLGDDLHEVEL